MDYGPSLAAWDEAVATWGDVDPEVAPLVAALNWRGLPTTASCAGHPEEFPQGLWYPWVDIGAPPEQLDAAPTDYLGLERHRRDAAALIGQVWSLVYAYYGEVGFPDDEVMLFPHPLGSYGLIRLQPSGFGAGGPAHRFIGDLLGDSGRQAFHARGSQEMEDFNRWLRN